jgi:SAM-dependent methyltransferase
MTGKQRVTGGNIANYDSAWSRSHYGAVVRGLFPAEEALIRDYFPAPPAHVLDLGCGAARTTVVLQERGYRVVGVDLSSGLLAEAHAMHPNLRLARGDATQLSFADERFDCIYPRESRVACLVETWRVLRRGGVFLISSHNAVGALLSGGYFYLRGHWNALHWMAQQRGNPYLREWYWRYDDPGGPQHLYSAPPSHTADDARRAGFEVLEIRGATGERDLGRITRHQQHVHFVLRKP